MSEKWKTELDNPASGQTDQILPRSTGFSFVLALFPHAGAIASISASAILNLFIGLY